MQLARKRIRPMAATVKGEHDVDDTSGDPSLYEHGAQIDDPAKKQQQNRFVRRALLLASCLIVSACVASTMALLSSRYNNILNALQYHMVGYVTPRKSRPLPPVVRNTLLGSSNNKLLIVDIMSIGSTTRPAYQAAQNETWARQGHNNNTGITVRNFVALTEEHHTLANDTCDASFLLQNAAKCLEEQSTTNQMKAVHRGQMTYSNLTGNPSYAEAWYCAQKRPAVGLGKVLADRYFEERRNIARGELPDWLLIVDDDTLFRMDLFRLAVSQLDPDDSYVLAGRHIPLDYPYGGWGTVLSRGALERFYRPLHCKFDKQQPSGGIGMIGGFGNTYEEHACSMLRMNMANERGFFVKGDTLADLMVKIATGRQTTKSTVLGGKEDEILASSRGRRTPFCYHSDWLSGYLFSHYVLMGHTIPLFPSCPEPWRCSVPGEIKENEREINAECWKDTNVIACHYQTPAMMRLAVAHGRR